MKFFFIFNILFLFFKSIKSLTFEDFCDGCDKVVLNAINRIVFTLDERPQVIKILYKGSFENPIQFIFLNFTNIGNNQYLCNDSFTGYDLAINQNYLIVVGYQNEDYNTQKYMKFHNYLPSKISPQRIINSIDYYLFIYLENTYLNTIYNVNIQLIDKTNSKAYNAKSCNYSKDHNSLNCIINIDKIGNYYLKVDGVEFNSLNLEVIESKLEIKYVDPNYDININENNFYLTTNVDPNLYSPLGHLFEIINADNKESIILSNCIKYDNIKLYCNKISGFFQPHSVYYFYYNQIKLEYEYDNENKTFNIQTGEQKYPNFRSIEPYDNSYINEGQSNLKKILIEVDDASTLDTSKFYIIDENKSKTNLNNCNNFETDKILCECNIYKAGEYYISYNNYTISYTINYINKNSYVYNDTDNYNVSILFDDIYLDSVEPMSVQLNSTNQTVNIYLNFNKNIYNYIINDNFYNISICNLNKSICNKMSNCSNYYNFSLYCNVKVNSSYLGYNYIYINNINTNKYISITQNSTTTNYYLITKVYPSQVKYGDINIELTFTEDAYKYKNNVKIGSYSADCYYYTSKPYVLECDVYISVLGDYSIYVNNINTGKILKVNTVTIDDDSSSITNYIKLNIFYLVFIFILFLFNF